MFMVSRVLMLIVQHVARIRNKRCILFLDNCKELIAKRLFLEEAQFDTDTYQGH